MQEYCESTYTVLFDIFKPAKLIGQAEIANNPKALDYIYTLQKNDLLQYPEDLVLDPWCNQVYIKQDIFVRTVKSSLSSKSSASSLSSSLKSDSEQSILAEKKLGQLRLEDWHTEPSHNQFNNYLDYRFSRLEITAVDMKKGEILSANEPLKAKLLGYGVVRLYKDRENEKEELRRNSGDQTTVAILGVPFYFTASDLLLGFFDKDIPNNVSHMRLLKTQTPNRFMVLLKFCAVDKAAEFVQKYNGKHFNSMEPEACQVIFIKEVLFRPVNHTADKMNTIPYLLDDPFTKVESPKAVTASSSSNIKPKVNTSAYTELATCPVCLERLDSNVTGLLTIPCQHTFHYTCLSKWNDDTCPVCRYSGKSDMRKRKQEEQDEKCFECGSTENMWICLICGHIGCGRYDQGHAISHYNETSHCFAMEITTQRVWDYSGDNYVHRLVQNEADGKLVELPLRDDRKGAEDSSDDEDNDAKIEKIGLEYSKMLISQLESQREFYDMKYEEAQNQLKLANDGLNEVRKNVAVLTTELSKAKEKLNSSAQQNRTKNELKEMKSKYEDENTINGGLSEKVKYLTERNDQLAKTNEDLQEQVKDLMFYLESRDKFKDAADDVKEGKVMIIPKKTTKKRH
ncbi:hypothetical protein FOA43_002162 [Brettanomyces nanus]|uniref:Uncharacterized protein n=1 Tax=Eeniella nana TaxID=13502 RepID=A0A875S086_EENNA|nr:uncharacterized protein FOA43_002162 [Brettanomyces nanus]QPG74826.1 hypothetical protein FOA43_002162 [Brettanomyces nanus]